MEDLIVSCVIFLFLQAVITIPVLLMYTFSCYVTGKVSSKKKEI